jgi:hypothetical protein
MPGAGKTMMTAIVIEYLSTKFQNDTGIGVTYLYCNYRRQQEQKPVDLLASLLKQLLQEQLSVPEIVQSLYGSHEKKGTRPSFKQISDVLHSVVASYSRAFIIIDALDECQVSDESRKILLSEMFKLQAKTGANLFATSRFIPDIITEFKGSVSLEIRASNEDVRGYLGGHMSQLFPFVSRNQKLQEEIKTRIVKAVDGM